MSAEEDGETRPATPVQSSSSTPILTAMGSPLLQQECQVLHWSEHRSAASLRARIVSLFNIPRIAKSLMLVDNERKHGGVA
jgi:hypothetical protein